MDRQEPIEPIESTEPTEPIERTDPFEAIERKEFSEAHDQRDDGVFAMPAILKSRRRRGSVPAGQLSSVTPKRSV